MAPVEFPYFLSSFFFLNGNDTWVSWEDSRLTMSKPLKMVRCMSVLLSRRRGREVCFGWLSRHWQSRSGALGQTAHLSYKRSENTCFRLCVSHVSLLQLLSSGVVAWKQPYTVHKERVWLFSDRTLFMDTEPWISYHFHVPLNIILLLISFNHLKM